MLAKRVLGCFCPPACVLQFPLSPRRTYVASYPRTHARTHTHSYHHAITCISTDVWNLLDCVLFATLHDTRNRNPTRTGQIGSQMSECACELR